MQRENIHKQFREFIYEQEGNRFNRCLAPFHSCDERAIKAHSIQNNKVLKDLSVNGHVIMLYLEQNLDKGPIISFKNVGKNDATTFAGLCAKHDNGLFQPIDGNDFDLYRKNHLFLLAYRSVLKELYSKMAAADQINRVYAKAVDYKMVHSHNIDLLSKMVVTKLAEAYSFYRFKHYFDCIYKYEDYELIEHQIIKIDHNYPTIAVNSIYSPVNYLSTLETRLFPPCILLNVFPQGDFTFVVFSYFKEHSSKIKNYIDIITNANGDCQKYLVSKIILSNCENFVLSPTYYATFNQEKKRKIKDFFMKTVFSNTEFDDPCLYLF